MKRVVWIIIGVALAAGAAVSIVAARFEEKIKPNTFVGIVPVGDLSRDEAKRRLRLWWETERVRELSIRVQNSDKAPIKATVGKLGITIDDTACIDTLPLDTFWDSTLRSVGSGDKSKSGFDLKFKSNGAQVGWLDSYVREAIGDPRPARVLFENGSIIRKHEVSGFKVDESRLSDAVVEAFQGEGELVVPIQESPKKIPDQELDKIKEVVAEFSTRFNAGARARNTNLQLASAKIDGMILMPGDVFSFNGIVGQRTVAAGYKEAPVIQSGRHDTGIGGGICQVSGTLYNAVVFANLKVVQRTNHSLPSAYLALGRDCTVSWPNLDFKFQNNTDAPIAISRTFAPGKLTFRILGTKVQGQEVKVETAGRKSWGRGVTYQHDPSLPFGKQVVVEKGSNGHAITVYRIVKQNGKLVKREVLNTSRYSGGPRIIALNKTAKKPLDPLLSPPPAGSPEPPLSDPASDPPLSP